jgi:hypothetical protein
VRSSRLIAAAAFIVCFGTGMALSLLFGLESSLWVPAGVTVSTTVAAAVFFGTRRRHSRPGAGKSEG